MSILNADRNDQWSVGRTSLRERVIVLGGLVAIFVAGRMFDWFDWKTTALGGVAYALISHLVFRWITRKLDEEARPEPDPYSEP
jgi:hypothetical protein